MTDDNIIGIDGRPAVELRTDQAEREAREEILRQKLKCVGFETEYRVRIWGIRRMAVVTSR
jgi:hypothetical protein